MADQGLRKLSISVATVLLGTGVYLGFNPTIASAAANVLNDTDNQNLTADPTNGQLTNSSYALNGDAAWSAQSEATATASANAASASSAASQANTAQQSAVSTNNQIPNDQLGAVRFHAANGQDQQNTDEPTLAPIQYSHDPMTGRLNPVDLTTTNPEIAQFVNTFSVNEQKPVTVTFYDGNHHQVTSVQPQQLADARQNIDLTYQLDVQGAPASGAAQQPATSKANSSAASSAAQPSATVTNPKQNHQPGQQPTVDTEIPEVRHLTYTVVDDTTGQTLVEPTILTSGHAGETIPAIVADNYAAIRKNWLGNVYVLDTAKADGRGYDLLPEIFSENGQPHDNVTIYLVHDRQATTQHVQVPRTTVYVYNNGGGAATADFQRLTFTHKKVVDKVNNKVVSDKWSPQRQSFVDLRVPRIRGYRPNMPAVNDHNIQHNQGPIVKTVIYTPVNPDKPVTQNLTYSVVDDSTGDTLVDKAPLASGGSGSLIPDTAGQIYEYVRQSWLAQGYRLDTTKANGQGYDNVPEYFDNNADVDQNVTVYLTHNQHETLNHAMVTRRILYYFANGQQASPAHEDQPLEFTEKQLTDAVTGEVTSDHWTPAQDFPAVSSPTIAGYQADRQVVENTKIDHNHGPITEVVTYIPNQQQLIYSVIDESTGRTLVKDGLLATGGTDTEVGAVAQQNYAKIRDYWLGHGYQLDTTKANHQGYDQLPAKFAGDDQAQNVTIYLTNPAEAPAQTEQVTPVAKTANDPANSVELVTVPEPQTTSQPQSKPQSNVVQLVTAKAADETKTTHSTNTVQLVESPATESSTNSNSRNLITLVETPSEEQAVQVNGQGNHEANDQGSINVTQAHGLLGLVQGWSVIAIFKCCNCLNCCQKVVQAFSWR